jgi:hypothetical protein
MSVQNALIELEFYATRIRFDNEFEGYIAVRLNVFYWEFEVR